MGEPVVVLAPHVRRQQVVQAGERSPPRHLGAGLEPLRVLVEHRVDDVDERLVAGEHPVATGEQVALEQSLAHVLGQHLDDPAVAGRACSSNSPTSACQSRPVTSRMSCSRLLASSSGANVRKFVRVAARDLAQPRARAPASPRARVDPAPSPRRRSHASPAGAGHAAARRRWPPGWRSSGGHRPARASSSSSTGRPSSSKSSSGRYDRSHCSSTPPMTRHPSRAPAMAPDGPGTCPPPGCRRRPAGRSSLSASARRSSATPAASAARAAASRLLDLGDARRGSASSVAAMAWCTVAGSSPATTWGA